MQVEGFLGKGLVNTFRGGDDATGTLSSPPFKIERRFLAFLIGGVTTSRSSPCNCWWMARWSVRRRA